MEVWFAQKWKVAKLRWFHIISMDNTLYIFTYMFLEIIVLKDYTMYWLLVFIVFVGGRS